MKRLPNSRSMLSLHPFSRLSRSPSRSRASLGKQSLNPSVGQSRASPTTTKASTAAATRRSFLNKTASISLDKSDSFVDDPSHPTHHPPPHSRAKPSSFCIWESGVYSDLKAKKVTSEIQAYFNQPQDPKRDFCDELQKLTEKNVSLAQMDRKYMKQEKLQAPYAHPMAKPFFGALRDADAPAAIDMVAKYPALLQTYDIVQQTPLHVAVKANSMELASFLIDNGLSYDGKDMVGRTPFKIAKKKNFGKLVNFMTHHKNLRRRKVMLVTGMEKRSEHHYKIMSLLRATENYGM